MHQNSSSEEWSVSESGFFANDLTLSMSLIMPSLFGKILFASSYSPTALEYNPRVANAIHMRYCDNQLVNIL